MGKKLWKDVFGLTSIIFNIRDIFPIDTIYGNLILTCAQDGSILVHKVGATLEKCAEISREEKNKLNAKKQAELKVV